MFFAISMVSELEALHSRTEEFSDAELDALQEDCFCFIDCSALLKDISELGAGLYANRSAEFFRPAVQRFQLAYHAQTLRISGQELNHQLLLDRHAEGVPAVVGLSLQRAGRGTVRQPEVRKGR